MKHIPSIHPIFMNSKKHIIGILNNILFLSMSEIQESLDFLFLLALKMVILFYFWYSQCYFNHKHTLCSLSYVRKHSNKFSLKALLTQLHYLNQLLLLLQRYSKRLEDYICSR